MAFCKNCGAELKEEKFCTSCGTAVEAEAQPTVSPEANVNDTGLNVKTLVWAIVNTAILCQILGILSLIFTVLAAEISSKERAVKYLKIAKILNIIGTISAALVIIATIAYIVFAIIVFGSISLQMMTFM